MNEIGIGKYVLLLGSFGDKEKDLYNNLKIALEDFKLNSTIVKIHQELKEKEGVTPRQLMHYLIAGSNFVIANDTAFGGQIAELEFCRNCGIITVIISKNGRRCSLMTLDHSVHSEDFIIAKFNGQYTNIGKLKTVVKELIKKVKDRKKQRQKQYHKLANEYQVFRKNQKENTIRCGCCNQPIYPE